MNDLRVTGYELISLRVAFIERVTFIERVIYYTTCKLLFAYALRVTIFCISYELLFTCKLWVIVYCTSYKLFLLHELRVIVHWKSYESLFIAPAVNYFLHTSYGLIFICEVRVTF